MPPGAARRIREYNRWEMVRNICHCEAAFAAVAISRLVANFLGIATPLRPQAHSLLPGRSCQRARYEPLTEVESGQKCWMRWQN